MLLPVFIVSFIAVRLAYWFLVEIKPPKGYPPGPKFPLPLVGDALQLTGKQPFVRLRMRYGDAFSIYLGKLRSVVVCGYDLIQEVGASEFCSDRLNLDHLGYLRGALVSDGTQPGLLSSEGRTWLEQRRFALHTLRNFGLGKDTMEEILSDEMQELIQDIDAKKSVAIDMKNDLIISMINALWRIVTGERLPRSDPKLQLLNYKMDRMLKEATNPLSRLFFDYALMRKINKIIRVSCMIEVFEELLDFVRAPIKEHRDTFQEDNIRDFTDAFLAEMQKREKEGDFKSSFSGADGELNLRNVLVDLFIAGSETTSNTLYWALLFMVLYPDVQDRIQSELDATTGKTRPLNLSDREKTHFTEATLLEVQRLANVTPVAVPHCNNNVDVTIGNGRYFIPKRTHIMMDMSSIMFDPIHFPNPHKFDPCRFLDSDSNFHPHPYVVPFGLGRRRCLGENLAKPSLYLFFTGILSAFKVEPDDPQKMPSPDDSIEGITRSPKPFKVRFRARP